MCQYQLLPDLSTSVQCQECFWCGVLAQTLYSDARGPLCPQCQTPLPCEEEAVSADEDAAVLDTADA